MTMMELWRRPTHIQPKEAGTIVCKFLDTATTSFGRATHYNTRVEQQEAELQAHEKLFTLSRNLYSVLLALPGVLDRSVQIGLKKLLSTERNGVPEEFLTPEMERAVLYHLVQALPAQRMLKLLDALRFGNEELGIKKANNARTRKLILKTLLSTPRLELWAIKYRSKVKRALVHAWGKRRASIIRAILNKTTLSYKEQGILEVSILKFSGADNFKLACDCVRFVFGNQDMRRTSLPLLRAFGAAKKDLSAGKSLPKEVLEGLRSTYHPDIPKVEVIRITKDTMTKTQKMQVQRQAKEAKIDVAMNPLDYDAVRLYIYAFEMGLTDEIVAALEAKAKKSAAAFPARYNRVGIVVDMSKSMEGSTTQPLRPAATALATRDMLRYTAEHGVIEYVSGSGQIDPHQLVRPMGDTAIADAFVKVLQSSPDAVYIISDGYENAPAGRFAEVFQYVREAGIDTPVYHLNPVMAAEAGGVKELAPKEGVPTLPVQSPQALGTTIVRGLIESEPERGINALVNMALTTGPAETRKLIEERS